jgi:type IV secretory pathway VirB4 component
MNHGEDSIVIIAVVRWKWKSGKSESEHVRHQKSSFLFRAIGQERRALHHHTVRHPLEKAQQQKWGLAHDYISELLLDAGRPAMEALGQMVCHFVRLLLN